MSILVYNSMEKKRKRKKLKFKDVQYLYEKFMFSAPLDKFEYLPRNGSHSFKAKKRSLI